MSLITEFVTDIKYVKGSQNVVADCLSRPVSALTIDPYDLKALAMQQIQDEEIVSYKGKLKPFNISDQTVIWCDTSLPAPRPFVPKQSRFSIFELFHNLSHPSIKSTISIIKSRFYWPDIDRNLRAWVRECQSCQQNKILRHTKSNVKTFDQLSERFQTVHVDIVGPLPSVVPKNEMYPSHYRYLLTCIDRSTRWVEAIPLVDITASSVAIAFFEIWISRFGVPLNVVTDRGSQFESELFTELSALVGFERLRTTAYHPQTNGMIERVHRTIKTAIMARKQNWLNALPVVLLSIRNLPNDSGFSPAVAVTGTTLLLPHPLVSTDNSMCSSDSIRKLALEMSKIDFYQMSGGQIHSTPKSFIPTDLNTSSHVWIRVDRVRRALEAPYTGPFKVLRRHPKFFIIETPTGAEQSVSIDRLKPAHIPNPSKSPEIQPEVPPEKVTPTSEPPPSTSQEHSSRSGRKITFKKDKDFIYY